MVTFRPNWKQWEQFPLGEKKIRKILQEDPNIPGPIRFAANSDNQVVLVIAGVHAGGAPGARADPRVHITISCAGQSYHVQLASNGSVYRVTS